MRPRVFRRYLAGIAAAGLLAYGSNAFAELIVNGDFNTGMPNAPGWTVIGNVSHVGAGGPPFWFGAGTAAENGPGVIAFNAGNTPPNGSIAQSFGTVAGSNYTVEFDFGVTENGTSATVMQGLIATVLGTGNIVLGTLAVSDTNSPSLPNNLDTYTFSFVANGAQATLRFSDLQTNGTFNFDGVLDNVSVTGPAPAQIPEPGTLGLLGVALAGLALRRRRR